ncbi:MAG: porin family protein [Capnocytophaga sp.]|nr:porin family protein [Capnocytophaga sp.]
MTIHKYFPVFLFSVIGWVAQAQDDDDGFIRQQKDIIVKDTLDTRYFEDQFYLGVTYNLLTPKADNVAQQNLSRGILFGFQKDIPLNERRNVGLGVGIGYSYDLIYSNMVALRINGVTNYSIVESLSDEGLSKNYFETQTLEFPIEFRWRTSTAESHKFWRVYTGVRLGYMFNGKNLFKRDDLKISFKNPDLSRKWQFKIYTAFGYNTWNFFVQYTLTPLLKDAVTTDNISLKSNTLQMGLMFYIL